MNARFSYQPRLKCICSSSIEDKPTTISKTTAFGDVHFALCSVCRSYLQAPQITTESLTEWYDSDEYQGGKGKSGLAYTNYAQDEAARVCEAHGRFHKHIEPYLPKSSKVLEIGCATGSLLSVIQENGHSVVGIDLSPRFAEAANQINGLDVTAGDFMTTSYEPASFDAIIMLGTASNMQDLAATLNKVYNLLKRDGFVLFNFPHADSLVAKLYGRSYWMFTPSISNFMSVEGCLHMLRNANFTAPYLKFDTQQPSLGKLLHHSKLDFFIPVKLQLLMRQPTPFPITIPAVKLVRAFKRHS